MFVYILAVTAKWFCHYQKISVCLQKFRLAMAMMGWLESCNELSGVTISTDCGLCHYSTYKHASFPHSHQALSMTELQKQSRTFPTTWSYNLPITNLNIRPRSRDSDFPVLLLSPLSAFIQHEQNPTVKNGARNWAMGQINSARINYKHLLFWIYLGLFVSFSLISHCTIFL